MKAKITRADGSIIELDGTPEEIARLLPLLKADAPTLAEVPAPLGLTPEKLQEILEQIREKPPLMPIPVVPFYWPYWPYCPDFIRQPYRVADPVPMWPQVPTWGDQTTGPWYPNSGRIWCGSTTDGQVGDQVLVTSRTAQ